MSIWLYESGLKRAWWSICVTLACLSAVFFVVQNQGLLPGGAIALPKLLWLLLTIIFFLVLPLLLSLDGCLPRRLRLGWGIFTTSMALRGVVELYLIYVILAWHPYMGIGHDLFSLALLIAFAIVTRSDAARFKAAWFSVLAVAVAMVFETLFAVYFRLNLAPAGEAAGPDPVYFVPPDAGFGTIIATTWVAVIILFLYLIWLTRIWLYERA